VTTEKARISMSSVQDIGFGQLPVLPRGARAVRLGHGANGACRHFGPDLRFGRKTDARPRSRQPQHQSVIATLGLDGVSHVEDRQTVAVAGSLYENENKIPFARQNGERTFIRCGPATPVSNSGANEGRGALVRVSAQKVTRDLQQKFPTINHGRTQAHLNKRLK
jgi:hypothetical protein